MIVLGIILIALAPCRLRAQVFAHFSWPSASSCLSSARFWRSWDPPDARSAAAATTSDRQPSPASVLASRSSHIDVCVEQRFGYPPQARKDYEMPLWGWIVIAAAVVLSPG